MLTLDEAVELLLRDGSLFALEFEFYVVPVPVCAVMLLEAVEGREAGAGQRASVGSPSRWAGVGQRCFLLVLSLFGRAGLAVGRVERVRSRDDELSRLESGEELLGELERVQGGSRERVGHLGSSAQHSTGENRGYSASGSRGEQRVSLSSLSPSSSRADDSTASEDRTRSVVQSVRGTAPLLPYDCHPSPLNLDWLSCLSTGSAVAALETHRRTRAARPTQREPETLLPCVPPQQRDVSLFALTLPLPLPTRSRDGDVR